MLPPLFPMSSPRPPRSGCLMGLPWVRLDANIGTHDKILALEADPSSKRWQAAWSYAVALAWSGGQGTDGHIPSYALASVKGTNVTARLLVKYRLWIEATDGWRIVNYAERQELEVVTAGKREMKRMAARRATVFAGMAPNAGPPGRDAVMRSPSRATRDCESHLRVAVANPYERTDEQNVDVANGHRSSFGRIAEGRNSEKTGVVGMTTSDEVEAIESLTHRLTSWGVPGAPEKAKQFIDSMVHHGWKVTPNPRRSTPASPTTRRRCATSVGTGSTSTTATPTSSCPFVCLPVGGPLEPGTSRPSASAIAPAPRTWPARETTASPREGVKMDRRND